MHHRPVGATRGDRLTNAEAVVALGGGVAALFGTYWDDSWHTDRGRDTLASPPHLLLYAGVLVALAVAAAWARRAARDAGWREVLRTAGGPRTAVVGGVAVLVSAPVDELWHTAYGRDSVLWSPPHLLAAAGSTALTVGLVLGLRRGSVTAAVGAALAVGAFVVPVMEYETDVPQFDVALYLPVLAVGLGLASPVVRSLVGGAWPFTTVAGVYSVMRLAIAGGLAGIGHSTPIVPPLLAVAVAVDVLERRRCPRVVVAVAAVVVLHAAYVPFLWLVPHGVRLDTADALASAALSLGAVAAVAAAAGGWRPPRPAVAAALFAASGALLLLEARPAAAHDPGQGDVVGAARFDVRVDGDRLDVAVALPAPACDGGPTTVVARRAGETVRAGAAVEDCVASATLRVDEPGRWFVYVERGRLEAWVPVETGDVRTVVDVRDLYQRPSPTDRSTQRVAGVPLVLAAAALLAGASRSAGNRERVDDVRTGGGVP